MQLDVFQADFKLYDSITRTYAADIIRMVLRIAAVKYDEVLIDECSDDWQRLKQDMPLWSLPVLEIDGLKIAGTTTICRHLAWRFGLSGQTAADDAVVDMLSDLLHEGSQVLECWRNAIKNNDGSDFQLISLDENARHYVSTRLGPILEKYLCMNAKGFLVGDKMTWADIMAISVFKTFFENDREDLLSAFPLIRQHYARFSPAVAAHPEKVSNEDAVKSDRMDHYPNDIDQMKQSLKKNVDPHHMVVLT
ncbi:unnamed protein product [Anisakis simplex]|uniref:Glutathione transferase n=1 Tax=Anisakis simplex TaxID=6269 RepID=A0A0M3JR44_ANISI|nr:unnamed protein product [Anisakis simplex]